MEKFQIVLEHWYEIDDVRVHFYTYTIAGKVVGATIGETHTEFSKLQGWIDEINRWVEVCQHANPVDESGGPDIPMEEKYEREADKLKLELHIGDFGMELEYDIPDQMLHTESREGFEISWPGFLYFVRACERFLKMIKAYGG